MIAHSTVAPLDVKHDDLEIVGQIVALQFPPGSGEADRLAHARKLLEVSAKLSYAISTFTHRVVLYAGRRPAVGDLRDETATLQYALEEFASQVRSIADAYRARVKVPRPGDPLPDSDGDASQSGHRPSTRNQPHV
jgi:hypothetical protein